MTRTENIARFVANLRYEDLPAEVVSAGKNMILDSIGAGIATYTWETHKAETTWKIAGLFGGKEEATAIVTGEKLPSVWAAFANASMCHGVDFDDTHLGSISHTGAPIVSAALAVAEALGASGKDLILAAVTGYEITVRAGMCIMPNHYEYWMPSATCSTLGASALTAKLYGGDEVCISDALGLAASSAAGLKTYVERGDFSKSFNMANAAFNGILAGIAAVNGGTGPLSALDMKRGFSYALCPDGEPNLEMLDKDLGVKYEILENVPKMFPSLLCSHPPIEAVLTLKKKYNIKAEDIEHITNRTKPLVLHNFCKYDPQTPLAARLSNPFCVAIAAATDKVDLASFTEEELFREDVREMVKRVEIVPDEEAEALSLEGHFPAFVTIDTKDGKSYTHRVYDPKGHPGNPVSQEELEGKFAMLATPVLGAEKAQAAIAACNSLDSVNDVRVFTALLVK